MKTHKYTSVDEYIQHMPEAHRKTLEHMRNTIREAIPEVQEVISYNMPAYKYSRILVYFALAKNHIGFYPTPTGIKAFKEKLSGYKHGKGSVQFPLDKALPVALIREIVKFRYIEEKARNH
ncbi:MAG: DUF1801 domain-containing protein [Bacteroidales bacterium]|nr:DUF1801 domain-containing protein [Bacteroidales bacterium]